MSRKILFPVLIVLALLLAACAAETNGRPWYVNGLVSAEMDDFALAVEEEAMAEDVAEISYDTDGSAEMTITMTPLRIGFSNAPVKTTLKGRARYL